MALQKRTLSFALTAGMDEKSSDATRTPDGLTKADNVVFDKKGRAKKRGGFVTTNSKQNVIGGSSITSGKAISKFQDETLILDGEKLYCKVTGTSLLDKGTYVPCTVENKIVRKQIDRRQSNAQIAEKNGVRLYVWEEYEFIDGDTATQRYKIYADVVHIETGATLISRELIGSNDIAVDTNSTANVTCMYKFGQPQCFTERVTGPADKIHIIFQRYDGSANKHELRYRTLACTSVTEVLTTGFEGSSTNGFAINDSSGSAVRLNDNYPVFELDPCTSRIYSEGAVCAYMGHGGELSVVYLYRSGSAIVSSPQKAQLTGGSGITHPSFGSYNARASITKFTPTGIMIKHLSDAAADSSYSIVVGWTRTDVATGVTGPQLAVVEDDLSGFHLYAHDLDPYPDGFSTGNLWLLNGTAGCLTSAADTLTVFCTVWAEDASDNPVGGNLTGAVDESLGHGVAQTEYTSTAVRPGMVPLHYIKEYTLNRNSSSLSITNGGVVGYNASVTSDFFRYNSKLYCVVSQVNDNALYPEFSETKRNDRGLSNNSVLINSEKELIGALETGQCASCLGTEWTTIAPPNGSDDDTTAGGAIGRETRRLWHGVQRVTSKNNDTLFVFGASRFHGYVSYGAGTYASSDYPDNIFGVSEFIVDFDPACVLASADIENAWVGTGGFLHGYDGNQVYEQGFIAYPSIRRVVQYPMGSSGYSAGGSTPGYPNGKTIKYQAVYVWSDDRGNLIESRPSDIHEVTTEAGLAYTVAAHTAGTGFVVDQVYTTSSAGSGTGTTIRVRSVNGSGGILSAQVVEPGSGHTASDVLTLSGGTSTGKVSISAIALMSYIRVQVYVPSFSRKENISIELYRNDGEGGSVFYHAGSVKLDESPTNMYVTFKDRPVDYAKIAESGLVIYTQGGAPANGFIGSCTDLIRHQNKLFAAGIDDKVFLSLPIREGSTPFFPATGPFIVGLSGDPSKVTAIESNLDHLLIFTEDNGYYTTGSGPNAIGEGAFRPPRLFANDQGAKLGAAHVDSPLGVFYQTDRGIYLVGRDMSVAYIGAGVEDTVGSNLAVSMIRHDDDSSIRIMLQPVSPSATGTDVYCIYNYYLKQWHTFGLDYTDTKYQVDEIFDGSKFQRLTVDGKQFEQDDSVFQDHSTAGSNQNYNVTIQTGFVSSTGVMKKDRVYRVMLMGEYVGAHDLSLAIKNDYSDNTSETFTKTISSAPTEPYIYRAHLGKQKTRAIQLLLTLSGSTAGAEIDGFAFEVGIRPDPTTFKTIADRTL